MSDVLIRALEGQGIWTIVCILLVIYVLKETEKRDAEILKTYIYKEKIEKW